MGTDPTLPLLFLLQALRLYLCKMPSKHINGKSLYYTIDERAQEVLATVILIHGLGSSSSYYLPVIPYLVPSIRCITIDIAGSGLSGLGQSE